MTLTIPTEERRVLLRSFWAALGALTAGAWLVAAWLTGFAAIGIAGAALGLAVASASVTRERFAWRVYRSWNERAARPFGAAATRMVTRLCYFVIFAAVGAAGTRLRLAGDGATSAWRGHAPAGPSPSGPSAEPTRGWTGEYVRWASKSGNFWIVSLLPFLAVLNLVATREEAAAAHAHIYTLF